MKLFHTFIQSKKLSVMRLILFVLLFVLSSCRSNLAVLLSDATLTLSSSDLEFTSQIGTNPIYDGGSTEVTITFKEPLKEDTSFKWTIIDNQGNSPTAFYVETSGEIPLSKNDTTVSFYIFSIPNSVNAGVTETFKIRFGVDSSVLSTSIMQMKSTQSGDIEIVTMSIVSLENQGKVNLANHTAYDVSGLCSFATGAIDLTFTSGVTSLTRSTVCDISGNWSVISDLSSLAEGSVIVKAIHTGTSVQGETQRTLLKDVVAPSIAITAPAVNSQINNSIKNGFVVTGTCSENFTVVTMNFVSSNGGSTSSSGICSNNLWNIATNLSSISDGVITTTVSQSDIVGNTVSSSRTFIKDVVVPTVTISSHTFLTNINSLNYTAQTFSGNCNKNGSTVTLSGDVTGANLVATCTALAWSLSSIEVVGIDGAKTVSASIADTSGNTSNMMVIVSKNTTLPTSTTLLGTPGAISNHTALNVNVSGNGVASYRFKVGDNSIDCTASAGYSAPTSISNAITTALGADGLKKLCVIGIDIYQNPQAFSNATTYSWTKNTVAPVVVFSTPAANSYVNEVNQTAFVISGTCDLDGVNNVSIQGSTNSILTSCTSGAWTKTLDFTGAADGPLFILVSQTNPDTGNVGQTSRLFTKYTVSPGIAITSPVANSYINNTNRAAFPVSGTCDVYSVTPNITITGGIAPVTAVCSGATWSANLVFNTSINATPQVSATIVDVAGNSKVHSRSFIQDTVDPTASITSPAVGAYINVGNVSAFTMQGTCSDVGTGNVKVLNGVTQLIVADCVANNTWQAVLNLTALADGADTLKVIHNDVASNTVEVTRLFNKDVVAPTISWIDPVTDACMSPATAGSFTVEGSCTTLDGNVTISSAQLSPSVTTSCTAGTFSRALNLSTGGLADLANFSINISQTDSAGNLTSGSRSFKYLGAVTPTVVFGGWDDVYAIGKKTYVDGNPDEAGVVKVKWKDWPASNTCQPNKVKVLRGSDTISSGVEREEVKGAIKQVKDTSLVNADFGKAWYYSLKVEIAGSVYDVVNPVEIQKIRVIAPPDNMALVHRWIANQETCGMIGKTTDPANNYRCSYNGQGKIIRSAQGYNDMEHDLLVDRFELGCNISSTCGPGSNQLCYSDNFLNIDVPSAGGGVAGAIGSVYFYTNPAGTIAGKCYVKTGAANTNWSQLNSANDAQFLTSTSNKAHLPLALHLTMAKGNQACSVHTVSLSQVEQYGDNAATSFPLGKRLLRQKEWRAAASWDRTMSFPSVYGTVDNYLNTMEGGNLVAGDPKGLIGKCNSDNTRHGNMSAAAREFYTNITPHHMSFETGSKIATIDCQSRYGLQDMVGNAYEWVSDQLSCPTSSQPDTCIGQTSTIDTSNTDMNGFKFDGFQGPGDRRYLGDTTFTLGDWNLQGTVRNGTSHFNPILGIPLMSNTGVNIDSANLSTWISSNLVHNDFFYLSPGTGTPLRGLLVGGSWNNAGNSGRWFSSWTNSSASTYTTVAPRCGIPVN